MGTSLFMDRGTRRTAGDPPFPPPFFSPPQLAMVPAFFACFGVMLAGLMMENVLVWYGPGPPGPPA